MGDAVVSSEPPQRFSGRAPVHKLGIGHEPPQPCRAWREGGAGGVVVERLHEDCRVDQAQGVVAAAQAARSDHRLDAAAGGDRVGGQLVVAAAQVGAE